MEKKNYVYTLEERNKMFEKDADGAYVNLVIPADYIKSITPPKELENKEITDLDLRNKKPSDYTFDEVLIMKKYSAYIYKQTNLSELYEEDKKEENDILLQLFKNIGDEETTITIFRNGSVDIDSIIKGISSKSRKKIDFSDRLENHLDMTTTLMKKYYSQPVDYSYIVSYKNNNFYSYDLYIDIILMIKNEKMELLSIYKKYDQEQRKEKINEMVERLNKIESDKKHIDISNVSSDLKTDERETIDFKLVRTNSLGSSRFFSDEIDISENIEIPEYLEFVGQINLSEFAKYDKYNLLPKTGMLYFFQSPFYVNGNNYENGKVIYSNDMNLVRKNANIDKDLISNYSVADIKNEIDKFSKRYYKEDDKVYYDSFANEDKNKIYGFYTDCQMNDSDIKKVSNKYIVLLQLGSKVYGEGVTTYLITEEDLKNKNFDNVVYKYVQS